MLRCIAMLALLVCAVLAAAPPAGASAHATLVRSVPSDGAQVAQAPSQVDLYFAQHLVQSHTGTFAIVLDDAGQQVSGEASIDPHDGTHLVVPLRKALDAGSYVVFWKSTSDDDGGVSLGNFSFVVGAKQQAQTGSVGPVSGQVLVPDEQRARALTEAPAPSGGIGAGVFAAGVAGSAVVGAALACVLLLLVRRRRRRPAAPRPVRGRRG